MKTNGFPSMELSAGAILALEHAEGPGTVRELAHVVGAGVVRANGVNSLRVERQHLFPAERNTSTRPSDRVSPTFHEATRRFHEQFLREALEQAGWNIAAVARNLDLTRGHIYNLMATLRIQRPWITLPSLRHVACRHAIELAHISEAQSVEHP